MWDYRAANFRCWLHSAEQKDANSHALLEVAMRYEIGMGVPMSPSTALVWYRRAADKGCPHARKYVEIWNELDRRTDVLRDIQLAANRGSAIGLHLCGLTSLRTSSWRHARGQRSLWFGVFGLQRSNRCGIGLCLALELR
jgi:hypothetical protein